MLLDQLAIKLQEYLQIVSPTQEEGLYLKSFCASSAGYISTTYRYNVLDKSIVYKTVLSANPTINIYLPELPLKGGSVVVTKPNDDLETTPYDIIGGTVYYQDGIIREKGAYTIAYTSGVDENDTTFIGDIEHCVQLAAWLYRKSDKGLDGVDQISTGVKESTKMFEGIPQNITTYFESRQPIRL